MWKKFGKALYKASDIMEILMAAVVAVAIVIAAVLTIPEMKLLWETTTGTDGLILFLEEIFNVVIAIEFLKMLCKPTADTVIEVLIFLVARHMIIGETAAAEDLLSVISIGILVLIQYFLKNGSFFFKKTTATDAEKAIADSKDGENK